MLHKILPVFFILVPFSICPKALLAQNDASLGVSAGRMMPISLSVAQIDTGIKEMAAIRADYPDSALHILQKLGQASREIRYPTGVAQCLMGIGRILTNIKNKPELAESYLRDAYGYCIKSGLERDQLVVQWHHCMGAMFQSTGNYDSATVHYYQAIILGEFRQWIGLDEVGPAVYLNLSMIQGEMHQMDKMLYYLKKAESTAVKKGLKMPLVWTYITFANYFLVAEKFDSVAVYLDRIERMDVPMGSDIREHLNNSYGKLYSGLHQPQKALPYLVAALQNSSLNISLRINTFINIAIVYFSLKEFTHTEQYLRQAYELSVSTHTRDATFATILYRLADYYDAVGQYKEAYTYRTQYAGLKDSLNDAEKIKSINQMETQFRTAEKDRNLNSQQLKLVQAQNSLNRRNLWTTGLVTVLLLVITLLFQRARVRRQRQKIERLQLSIEGEERERARIGHQLHDDVMVEFSIVKMNLETLPVQHPEFAALPAYQNIVQQLQQASVKLRQTAHNLMPDALLEEGLIPALRYFCKGVEQMTGLVVDFQSYGDLPRLPVAKETGLYRITQELVQNIIKHAQASSILVQLDYREQQLSLTVEDDGKGIAEEHLDDDTGMGIKGIRSRLKVMGGSMDIRNCLPSGTAVFIELGF